jgi:hypothetical protein
VGAQGPRRRRRRSRAAHQHTWRRGEGAPVGHHCRGNPTAQGAQGEYWAPQPGIAQHRSSRGATAFPPPPPTRASFPTPPLCHRPAPQQRRRRLVAGAAAASLLLLAAVLGAALGARKRPAAADAAAVTPFDGTPAESAPHPLATGGPSELDALLALAAAVHKGAAAAAAAPQPPPGWVATAGADYCGFKGVTCDKDGRVVGVSFHAKGLAGGLPSAELLARLPRLHTLDLGQTLEQQERGLGVAGAIPADWARLPPSLKVVDLR